MAVKYMPLSAKLNLEAPKSGKCRWLKAILGLQEWEMMGALGGISSKTLANWLSDPADKAVGENAEFQLLFQIIQLARGVLKAEHLADWLHEPSEEFNGMAPVELLMRPETRGRVIAVLRDLKYGNLA